ncbi:MAG: hypothetical protein GF370_03560 [Candidatus Nealsonbacteria bacterium]|nr:hypothetical protein [Candidatus Nealsonbacteria bacterium]
MEFTEKELKLFGVKTKYMTPRCKGAIKQDDLVCQYCFLNPDSITRGKRKAEKEINENTRVGRSFFYHGSYCKDKRSKLKRKIAEAEEELKKLDRKLSERNESIKKMDRLPVGIVRQERVFWDFTDIPRLTLQIKSSTHDGPIYGKRYEKAIGEIYKLIPGGAYPFDGKASLGYVKSVNPEIKTERYRTTIEIEPLEQEVNEQGNLIVTAKVVDNPNRIPVKKTGEIIKIELYEDSAKRMAKVDALGPLKKQPNL